MLFIRLFRLIPILGLLFVSSLCSAQDRGKATKEQPEHYVERSKTIAMFYKLLNQESEPTVEEAFLIFHPEMEWSVVYTEYADNRQKALDHINGPEDTQKSLLFTKLREMKDRLQFGEHEPNTSPHLSILPVPDNSNALKAVFPRQKKALEITFTFPLHPDHYKRISNIYLENGESALKLIGAK